MNQWHPKHEAMSPKHKPVAPKMSTKKRELKECSKPNLKSEQNFESDWNNGTHNSEWEGKANKAQWRRMKHKRKIVHEGHKSLILTRVNYNIPTDIVYNSNFTKFSQMFTRRPWGIYYIDWELWTDVIWVIYHIGWELTTDVISSVP